MSEKQEQRCGTCRWHEPHKAYGYDGYCKTPRPFWLSAYCTPGNILVKRDDGTDCPCWRPQDKQTEDSNG